jgi:hypothetical protein
VLSDPFSPLACGIDSDLPLPSGPSCCTDVTGFPPNDTIGVPIDNSISSSREVYFRETR